LKSGVVSVEPAAFRKHRIAAENDARALAAGGEATLAEIYKVLESNLRMSSVDAEMLLRMELELEARSIVAVPAALEMVNRARSWSRGIIFASDMYLPSQFILEQLKSHGFWFAGDDLYVSSEWRASKANGRLFSKILESERLQPALLLHTGDRRDADCEIPLTMGIRAKHRDVVNLTRYEEMLEQFSDESCGFASLIAGASRLTRLEVGGATRHLAALCEVSSSLVAPVVTLYALWLLRQVKERSLERLYFVARDGYVLKRVTDSLAKAFGLNIETQYLYGSRQAWHVPAITDLSDESLSWLFEKTRKLTPRIILGRLQIAPEQISEIMIAVKWPQETWDRQLDDILLNEFRADLLGSREFGGVVTRRVAAKQEIALRYLQQEGLFDGKHWAIVDLGWHGRLQRSLETLLGMKRIATTLGLYFALFSDSPALSDLTTTSYLDWDLRHPPAAKEIPSLVFLMESFCTAPHGSTVGYESESNGRVIPQCRENGVKALQKWGLTTVHECLAAFAKRISELTLSDEILNWDSRNALLQVLGAFSRDPLPGEARAWGSFAYEDEQGGSVTERLTKGYEITLDNLKMALTFGNERYLPASWNVLWHGGQRHMLSMSNIIMRLALSAGNVRCRIGRHSALRWRS
jgi:FMN phosphatase YigB (HAD superfamily)